MFKALLCPQQCCHLKKITNPTNFTLFSATFLSSSAQPQSPRIHHPFSVSYQKLLSKLPTGFSSRSHRRPIQWFSPSSRGSSQNFVFWLSKCASSSHITLVSSFLRSYKRIFFASIIHHCHTYNNHSSANMFNSHRYQPLLYLKLKALITVPFQRTTPFVLFSLKFYTSTTSQSHSFGVSYLINNLGFSPQVALKASKRLRFNTPQKADSVLAFFKSHGFSDSQISSIVRKQPQILTCDTQRVLPKFEFLASKGASSSDIVLVVTRNPVFVNSSLEKNIIPTYELMKSFFQSDEKTLYCIVTCPYVFMGDRLAQNVKMLVDEGVSYATIGYMFRTRASVLLSHDLRKAVDEVKELGFDPSKILFGIALMAKTAVHKSRWDAKVDAFKSWGWSAEAISEAFRRQPLYMLTSKDKINEVMRLWVNQLGWNSLALVKRPEIFGFSLERRIIPRAFVLQYLLAKGLRDKNCSLYTPFCISEKLFLKKFVECFTEERSQLLKIYQEKKEY